MASDPSTSTTVPPLPPLDDLDLGLTIFTHHTLSVRTHPEYGDNKRLGDLGNRLLQLATTLVLYSKRPILNADQIITQREEILSDANYELWTDKTGLRKKLILPPNSGELVRTPEEMRLLFDSYMGGVYLKSGMGPIQDWIHKFVSPDTDLPFPPSSVSSGLSGTPGGGLGGPTTTPLYQQQWAQQPLGSSAPPPYPISSGSSSMGMAQPQPPPPGTTPPPLPTAQPAGSIMNVALFNQIASQQGYTVHYDPSSVGPSHQPRWTVKVYVNGTLRGIGEGKNQKQAKDAAVQQACIVMGWRTGYGY